MTRGRVGIRLALLTLLSLPVAATAALAQAGLAGIVREDSTGRPLAGVEVVVQATGITATTGANGRYLISRAPSGRRCVLFRSVGFMPVRIEARIRGSDTAYANAVPIPGEVRLPTIALEGEIVTPRGAGIEAFEERKRLGIGKFSDSLELRNSGHLRLGDLLARKGGATFQNGWVLHPAHRDMAGNLDCAMQDCCNGVKVGAGGRLPLGAAKLAGLEMFDLSGLKAIEVYRAAAQVPVEYRGTTAECGAVLLWSRP